ncbi:hypothetical protein ABPG72_001891 [Tetrahymena utriculariae]
MEKSKKSQRSFNSRSQAISSLDNTPKDHSLLLGFEDNPEQHYVHCNPRHCGLFFEYVIDGLQFSLPDSLQNIDLRVLRKNKIMEQVKNELFQANPDVIRSIIDTSRYLWMIDTLLQMQIKAVKGLSLSLISIIILLVVQIFVNLKEIQEYYIGYIAVGATCIITFPIVYQRSIIPFILLVIYQLMLIASIFYLCIFQQNFSPSKNDFIFIVAYFLAFVMQFYFFFYFEIKRRLLCYLLKQSEPN